MSCVTSMPWSEKGESKVSVYPLDANDWLDQEPKSEGKPDSDGLKVKKMPLCQQITPLECGQNAQCSAPVVRD